MRGKNSDKGLATPVSLSFLIFSFTILTVATYYVSISSVSVKSSRIRYVAAKQDVLSLENAIHSISWSPGSSIVKEFRGYGGKFETHPDDRILTINFSMGSLSEIIFNSSIGYLGYEAPPTDINEVGLYLRGDAEPVVNQSFLGITQMYIRVYNGSQEIYLGYRPLIASFTSSLQNNQINIIRIFIINLNSSENLLFTGGFRLRIRCLNITSCVKTYNLTESVSSASIKVTIDGETRCVTLPLSSEETFTLARLEVFVCNVKVEEVNI